MTPYVFLILCALIVTNFATELKCGIGEEVDNCPANCAVNYCPENENYDRTCNKPTECPPPACKCRFNYSRAKNGTCIPTRECPAFPCSCPNEKFVSCPPYCPTDDCSQATPDGHCPLLGHILIVVQCRPSCRCKDGYWRKQGVCVPYDQCPPKDDNNSVAPFLQFFN